MHHVAIIAIYCHYCNVDIVLSYNVTCYTNSLLLHIHGNTIDLLNIMCTLVATCMILGRLECILLSKVILLYNVRATYWTFFSKD